jgi:hypothetical protein
MTPPEIEPSIVDRCVRCKHTRHVHQNGALDPFGGSGECTAPSEHGGICPCDAGDFDVAPPAPVRSPAELLCDALRRPADHAGVWTPLQSLALRVREKLGRVHGRSYEYEFVPSEDGRGVVVFGGRELLLYVPVEAPVLGLTMALSELTRREMAIEAARLPVWVRL